MDGRFVPNLTWGPKIIGDLRKLSRRVFDCHLMIVEPEKYVDDFREAGADIFLMPSRYEPCGLNQIYSLRYGTVPIVRATGGLDDTIENWDPLSRKGTGFKFSEYSGEAMLATIKQALQAFKDKAAWQQLMRNGMGRDFSWNAAAKEYVRVYEKARQVRAPAPL